MKKIISVAIVTVMIAAFALTAHAASIANHLFDKQGGIDAGGKTWSVYGWIVTDAEITSVGYILDDGDISSYTEVVTGIENDTRNFDDTKPGQSDAYRDLALEDAVKNGGMSGGVGWDVLRAYRIQVVLDITKLEAGKHTVVICLKFKDGGIAEAFRDSSEFKFTISGSGEQTIDGKGASTRFLLDSDNSDETKIEATGWAGSTVKTVKLGYKIDNEKTVFNEKYVKMIPLDELDSDDMAVMDLAGQYAFRFRVNFPVNELPSGYHHIKLIMVDEDGGETAVGSGGGSEELLFDYETEEEVMTDAPETAAHTEGEATAAAPETAAETAAATEAGAEDQNKPAQTEAPSTEKSAEGEGKGLPTGAIIAIIAAAVIVIGAVIFIIKKKK